MAAANFKHTPILLNEVAALFSLKPGMLIVDGTLGGGGHAEKILESVTPGGKLIGIDRDPAAIEAAKDRLKKFDESFIPIRGRHEYIADILKGLGIEKVDGVLMDLGVSSHQFDTAERGFSYKLDAQLDMRMNPDDALTAKKVVNEYSERDLNYVISRFGEEKFSSRIAKKIVEARNIKTIETTCDLAEIVKQAIPAATRRTGGHPAKKTFQALRIEVNQEIVGLENTIRTIINLLNDKGRLCVITFHSLEDRAVKHTMREMENPCTCASDIPMCICGKKTYGNVITRKPISPSLEELDRNPRAKSAKLRCFQREIQTEI